jgi:hypothetical protein
LSALGRPATRTAGHGPIAVGRRADVFPEVGVARRNRSDACLVSARRHRGPDVKSEAAEAVVVKAICCSTTPSGRTMAVVRVLTMMGEDGGV